MRCSRGFHLPGLVVVREPVAIKGDARAVLPQEGENCISQIGSAWTVAGEKGFGRETLELLRLLVCRFYLRYYCQVCRNRSVCLDGNRKSEHWLWVMAVH
jgi:hypothetical protein